MPTVAQMPITERVPIVQEIGTGGSGLELPPAACCVWHHLAVLDDRTFDDVLAANRSYAERFTRGGLDSRPEKRLAVVTCMDGRLDPLGMLGLEPGDVVVLRNAGARVSGEVLESLELAERMLGVERVLVIAHNDCRAAAAWAGELAPEAATRAREGVDMIRSATRLVAGGAVYDESTGRLTPVD